MPWRFDMVQLEIAISEAKAVIDKYMPELHKKYEKVDCSIDLQHLSLACCSGDLKISMLIHADLARRISPRIPKSGLDYQKEGGHTALIEKINSHNVDAWHVEVKIKSGSVFYEVGFAGSENNWNLQQFESDFLRSIVNR
jgi:hypothetical protein